MIMHAQHLRFSISLAVLCAGLAGCTQFEPFQRQGTWHQNDAPMHNIAAELANPEDLYHGTGGPVLTGTFATSAIGSIADGSAAGAAPGATSSGGDNTSGASSASGAASGLGGAAGASGGATGMAGGSM
jgi:type IV pilus biogenesis protein CpaD/CtpE